MIGKSKREKRTWKRKGQAGTGYTERLKFSSFLLPAKKKENTFCVGIIGVYFFGNYTTCPGERGKKAKKGAMMAGGGDGDVLYKTTTMENTVVVVINGLLCPATTVYADLPPTSYNFNLQILRCSLM